MKLFKLKPVTTKALLIGLGLLLLRFIMIEVNKQGKLNSIEKSESQFDAVREIERVGIDNLSDDALELLSRQTIDNVNDLVEFLKVGGFLGPNFDEFALRIYRKVDTMGEITMQQRNKIIEIYSDSLDRLTYLDGADEIKEALVKDFTSEFDSKYSDRIIRAISPAHDNENGN